MLNGKVAIVYGAGSIGSTVAKAFAAAGADVQLASRSGDRLEKVAREIRESDGNVLTAVVDALHHRLVDELHPMVGPGVLGDGIRAFETRPPMSLRLIEPRTWDGSSLLLTRYAVEPAWREQP